ncbi:MAG: sulfotransferase [Candidatus Hydrogenedentes bacterium]|nr:sulfotransferase [Candidatus Hydrogenedentota bacterium]
MMFWAFSVFFRLFKLTLFHDRNSFARMTPKRIRVMAVFLPVIFFGQVANWIGLLLDDVFFRGYRKVAIQDPVFIIGIPRSGTTLLHRIMAQDTERFTSFRLWEIIFAPSITQRKFWATVSHIDRMIGSHGRRFLAKADRQLFAPLSEIHKMSLFDYDEDDLVLTTIFSSSYMLFPFPFFEETWRHVRFDVETCATDQDHIMRFYAACVRRHLYFHGEDKLFLSKNPAFSPKIDAIRRHFPRARVVCSMRTPYEAIPSLISLLHVPWDFFGNDTQGLHFRDRVLELAGYWYRHPMHHAQEWQENRFLFLIYDDLKSDVKSAVADIYQRFGFVIGELFASRLEIEHERARAYKSNHQYSLEKFGLTAEGILLGFGDVFERFDFDKTLQIPAEPTTYRG